MIMTMVAWRWWSIMMISNKDFSKFFECICEKASSPAQRMKLFFTKLWISVLQMLSKIYLLTFLKINDKQVINDVCKARVSKQVSKTCNWVSTKIVVIKPLNGDTVKINGMRCKQKRWYLTRTLSNFNGNLQYASGENRNKWHMTTFETSQKPLLYSLICKWTAHSLQNFRMPKNSSIVQAVFE